MNREEILLTGFRPWLPHRKVGGGDERTRTADPLRAKQVLYRLSYVPMSTWGKTLVRVWHR